MIYNIDEYCIEGTQVSSLKLGISQDYRCVIMINLFSYFSACDLVVKCVFRFHFIKEVSQFQSQHVTSNVLAVDTFMRPLWRV